MRLIVLFLFWTMVYLFIKNLFVAGRAPPAARRAWATAWEHQQSVRAIQEQMAQYAVREGPVTLSSSNHAFGLRRIRGSRKLDMSRLDRVLGLDAQGVVEFEGSCTIERVLTFLEGRGRTLRVIPDMKHLKMGGIVSGIGGGSGSWREGAFHDAVVDCDVLLASGELLRNIGPDDDTHRELFHALPGALGTLGYITRMRMDTIPLQPFVLTRNLRCHSLEEFLQLVDEHGEDADFVDGTAFGPDHIVCVLGYKKAHPPREQLDNFVNHRIYWKALRDVQSETTHALRLMDYIYRWETDLYYTTMNPQLPGIVRNEWLRQWVPARLIPAVKDGIAAVHPVNIDNVCTDVLIPWDNALSFWSAYTTDVGVYPVYLCPARSRREKGATFWTGEPLLDFGIGYGVLPKNKAAQHRARVHVERCMLHLGGRKLPYSYHSLSRDEFWSTRGGKGNEIRYQKLRDKYGAQHFPDVYDKLQSGETPQTDNNKRARPEA